MQENYNTSTKKLFKTEEPITVIDKGRDEERKEKDWQRRGERRAPLVQTAQQYNLLLFSSYNYLICPLRPLFTGYISVCVPVNIAISVYFSKNWALQFVNIKRIKFIKGHGIKKKKVVSRSDVLALVNVVLFWIHQNDFWRLGTIYILFRK